MFARRDVITSGSCGHDVAAIGAELGVFPTTFHKTISFGRPKTRGATTLTFPARPPQTHLLRRPRAARPMAMPPWALAPPARWSASPPPSVSWTKPNCVLKIADAPAAPSGDGIGLVHVLVPLVDVENHLKAVGHMIDPGTIGTSNRLRGPRNFAEIRRW